MCVCVCVCVRGAVPCLLSGAQGDAPLELTDLTEGGLTREDLVELLGENFGLGTYVGAWGRGRMVGEEPGGPALERRRRKG